MRVLHKVRGFETGFSIAVSVCLAVLAAIALHGQAGQAGPAGQPPPAGQPGRAGQAPAGGDATAVMAAAHEALGSETKINSVKTIVATGRTRQVQGDNLVPIEFEINIELPDKYVRTDEIPARESGPTTRGFNGSTLIQIPEAAAPAGRGGAPPAGRAAAPPAGAPPAPGGTPPPAGGPGPGRGGPAPDPVAPLKQDFVRLTLGMFATSFSSYPLTFSLAGVAEAPEGKADVVDVKGPANFSARLFINSQTHLPLMLSWTVPPNLVPVMPGQPAPQNLPPGSITFEAPGPPPGPTATPEERQKFQQDVAAARAKAMQSAHPTENRIYYADYRDVDGLKMPFRIRRAVGATTTEETVFDRFKINGKIDAKKFEARK